MVKTYDCLYRCFVIIHKSEIYNKETSKYASKIFWNPMFLTIHKNVCYDDYRKNGQVNKHEV